MSFPCESYFFTNTHTFTFTHTHKHTHTHVLFPCTNTRREKYKVLARHELPVRELLFLQIHTHLYTHTHTQTHTHTNTHTHTHTPTHTPVLFPCTNTRREKYKVLARHEVSVPEVQLEELDSLGASWEQYLVVLEEGQSKLERHKDNFREKVCVV